MSERLAYIEEYVYLDPVDGWSPYLIEQYQNWKRDGIRYIDEIRGALHKDGRETLLAIDLTGTTIWLGLSLAYESPAAPSINTWVRTHDTNDIQARVEAVRHAIGQCGDARVSASRVSWPTA
jgi:hypothetical protein